MISYHQHVSFFSPGNFLLIPKLTEVRFAIQIPEHDLLNVTLWMYRNAEAESSPYLLSYLTAKHEIEASNLLSKDYLSTLLDKDLDTHLKTRKNTSENPSSIKEKLLSIVREDLNYAWDVEEICKRLYLSKSTLFRLLKSENSTFTEVLTSERLNAARQLLKNTALPIDQIAYQCGFASQSYFGKRFRCRFGMTPTEFRKS